MNDLSLVRKNIWEIKSKNYFARVKIKKNEKDGEYYDIHFGLKGQGREKRLHFGIRVEVENETIGGKVFFIEPRQAVSRHIEKTFNPKTGELVSKLDSPYGEDKGRIKAELHYATIYDDTQKRAFLTKFEIVEFIT